MPSLYLLPLALLPGRWALALLLLSAVVLGMPHGAADLLVAQRLGWRWHRFIAWYLLLAALPLLLMLVWPAAGLVVFLALTIWHWGRIEEKGGLGYLRAASVLLIPFIVHRSAITPFVTAFAGGFALPAPLALAAWLALLAWALAQRPSRALWQDTAALIMLALLAHPYAALAGYFLLQHSLASLRLVGVSGRQWLTVYGGTLGGVLIAAALYPHFGDPLAAYMSAIFALTLPHTVTMEAWLRRGYSSPACSWRAAPRACHSSREPSSW